MTNEYYHLFNPKNTRISLIERFLLFFKKKHFASDKYDGKIQVITVKYLFGKMYVLDEIIYEESLCSCFDINYKDGSETVICKKCGRLFTI